jgi:hypothetical protein
MTERIAEPDLTFISLGLYNPVMQGIEWRKITPRHFCNWYLHGHLSSTEIINDICQNNNFTAEESMEELYKALITFQ